MLDELFKAYPTLFQYIICCWFKYLFLSAFIPSSVSIHYMLLVQKEVIEEYKLEEMFQYIICCWFN